MKNKKIIAVSLCMLISLAGLLYYANFVTASAKEIFEQDGFVLSSSLQNEGVESNQQQYYFKANSSYQKKWPSKILFHDTESSKVVLQNQSYLHYTNGDMGAFADGVLVDLNTLEQSPINYYRIKAGAILKKVGDSYQMNYLGKKVTMSNFLWKLSEFKYLIVSPSLKVSLGENNSKEVKSFLEVEIKDKGIITLRNQNVSFQTVVEGSKIELPDGMTIDFNKKEIKKGDKTLFSLTQMVVDSNSNIEIVPDENKSNPEIVKPGKVPPKPDEVTNNPSTDNENPNNPGGGNGDSLPGVDLGGTLVPSLPNTTPDVDASGEDTAPKQVPTITLNSLKASIAGVFIQATINDADDVLTSDGVNVKIFEKSSNKLVYSTNVAKGVQKIEQDIQSLNTNTDYILVISGTYIFNGVEYTNDFLNKQFRTDMLDLSYKINEKTSDMLVFKVFADRDTKISSANLTLYNADKTVNQRLRLTEDNMQVASQGGYLAEFRPLQPNTTYYTKLTDVVYDTSMTISEYDTFKEVKTLKTTPTLTKPTVSIDKRNGVVNLYPGDVIDPDNGIQKYRYEIIDALDPTNIVYSTQRDLKGSVEVVIDGKQIQRKHNYFWRLVVSFNDNDKVVEVASPESDMFSLDTNNLPDLAFTKTTIQHDSILGTILVNDADGVILRGDYTDNTGKQRTSSIKVYATDPVSNAINIGSSASTDVPSDWDGKMNIPIDIAGGLRANETETFKIYADVNLGENSNDDGNEFNRTQYYLGELRVLTAAAVPIRVTAAKNTSIEPDILSQPFILNTRLAPIKADEEKEAEYVASTLQSINYAIYRGRIPADDVSIENATAQLVVSGSVSATDMTAQNHNSSIKTELFDKEGEIKSADIKYNWSNLNSKDVTIVFKDGVDYVGNKISLGNTANRVFSFQVNGVGPTLPANPEDSVDFQLIRNSQLAPGTDWVDLGTAPDPALNNDTVVGISFVPQLNNSTGSIHTIRYRIRDRNNVDVWNSVVTLRPDDTSIARVVVPIANGVNGAGDDMVRRGHRYRVIYEVDLDLNYDGTVDTTLLNNTGGIEFGSRLIGVRRQAATFKSRINYDVTAARWAPQYIMYDVDASYRGTDADRAVIRFTRREPGNNFSYETDINVTRSRHRNEWLPLTYSRNIISGSTVEMFANVLVYEDIGLADGDGRRSIYKQRFYQRLPDIQTFIKAETEIKDNQLNVILKSATGKTDQEFRKALTYIAGGQITVQDTNDASRTVTSKILSLQPNAEGTVDARISVPLTVLRDLREKQLTVSTKLYYVNGNTKTDVEAIPANTLYAVEVANFEASVPRYLFNNNNTSLAQQENANYPANNSIFTVTKNRNNLVFESKINSNRVTYNSEYTNTPLKINIGANINQNVELKELSETSITTDSTGASTGFDAIAGSISVSNGAGNLDIIRGLDRALINYNLDMTAAIPVAKANKVYFELYQLKSGSTTEFETTPTKTYEKAIANGRQTITLDGLSLGQTYKMKEYVKVDVADTTGVTREIKQYLFDTDKNTIGYAPTFTTSSKVDVTSMKVVVENKKVGSTVTRQLKMNYNLNQIGFTKIKYTIKSFNDVTDAYDQAVLTKEDMATANFKQNMEVKFPIGLAADQLKWGVKYQVLVEIFSSKNPHGVTTETLLSDSKVAKLDYSLSPLSNPIAAIQLVPGLDGMNHTITATINMTDPDFVSTDSKYKVILRNASGADITPTSIRNVEYDYSVKNNTITFTNDGATTPILENADYSVEITSNVDLLANNTITTFTTKSMVTTLNSFGVGLGEMEIVKGQNNGEAELQFYGAVNLNKVKKISYTLYDVSSGTSVSVNDEVFDITTDGSGTGQYWKHTISGFTTRGKYSVQVQFLTDENELIGTLNKRFIY